MDRGFKLGIELEVLLTPKYSTRSFSDLEDFANFFVTDLNSRLPPGVRIHSDVDGLYEGPDDYREWSNSRLRNRKMEKCFELVDRCNHQAEIADLTNDGGNRRFAWNFTNLYHGGKSTVEFRQAPPAAEPTMCLAWAEFVVAFVHAAKELRGVSSLKRYTRDAHGLKRFLTHHAPPGFTARNLKNLFVGKFGHRVPRPLPTLTTGQRDVLERKDAEARRKDLVMKKLTRLLSE
ncbi:hypothetical protein N7474_006636 [Penicillium riverlandense]|uniref:uncharacterized protein n=1 Tax=Penicillium riverlandense TaxID=1903569 RepID=UPI002547F99D|nr:uncharacterized protein N7474_006636 [Penicillium riverlandense]KAJ5814859.1 hypothetical protein N7474_006636 [Penicillium riverlandense]